MFGFNKHVQIDETTAQQIADLKQFYGNTPGQADTLRRMLAGLDCDSIPRASGRFGSMTNPIPVNGVRGEIKYLKRIRCSCGTHIFFHRMGSCADGNDALKGIDIFETVCATGTHWKFLFLDPYHPRRSLKTPEGYTNAAWDPKWSPLPVAYGVPITVDDFPHGLPFVLAKSQLGVLGERLGQEVSRHLGDGNRFVPPSEHIDERLQLSEGPDPDLENFMKSLIDSINNGEDITDRTFRNQS